MFTGTPRARHADRVVAPGCKEAEFVGRVAAELGDAVLDDLGEGGVALVRLDEAEEGADHHHGLGAAVHGRGAGADDGADGEAPEDDLGAVDGGEARDVGVDVWMGSGQCELLVSLCLARLDRSPDKSSAICNGSIRLRREPPLPPTLRAS